MNKLMFGIRLIVAFILVVVANLLGWKRRLLVAQPSGRIRTARRRNADAPVNLTAVRAWYDVSTTADLNGLFNTLYEDALFVAREVNLMQALVTRYAAQGLATRTLPVYPALSATKVAEGTDFAGNSGWQKTAGATFTPQISKVQVVVTESMIETDPANTMRDASLEMGGAIATDIDTDLVNLFSSFSSDKGTANAALTLTKCSAALALLRNAKIVGDVNFVLHPYGWHDLWVELGQPAATYQFLGDTANQAMREYVVQRMLGAMWYIDANIAVDADSDAVSGAFVRAALGLDMRQATNFSREYDQSIAGRGWEVDAETWYAVAVRRSTYGVALTHDATEPT